MTELTLFDATPELAGIDSGPAVVYDKPNRRHGHLLIAAVGADYVFINDGGGVIRFGHFAGPAVELTPEQLRTIGDYCHRMAARIET
jgi:hypothetical protein